jgi:hypothetical protein
MNWGGGVLQCKHVIGRRGRTILWRRHAFLVVPLCECYAQHLKMALQWDRRDGSILWNKVGVFALHHVTPFLVYSTGVVY